MSIITVKQDTKTQSSLVAPATKGGIKQVSFHPNQINLCASELWEFLSERETAITYKQAASKTWKLLKYLFALFLLIFLLGAALIISIWAIGFNLGSRFRAWLSEGKTPEEVFKEAIKIVVFPIQKIVDWANKYVKKYFPEWNPSNYNFFELTEEE